MEELPRCSTDMGAKLYGWQTPAWSAMDDAAVADQHPAVAAQRIKAEWRVRIEFACPSRHVCVLFSTAASAAAHAGLCARWSLRCRSLSKRLLDREMGIKARRTLRTRQARAAACCRAS